MKKFIKSASDATRGVFCVFKEERNFRIQIFVSVIVVLFMIIFDFSSIEISIVIFAVALVFTTEIINTSIENLLDKLHPKHDRIVGKIKDMTAGAVLIASLCALVAGIIIFIAHFS